MPYIYGKQMPISNPLARCETPLFWHEAARKARPNPGSGAQNPRFDRSSTLQKLPPRNFTAFPLQRNKIQIDLQENPYSDRNSLKSAASSGFSSLQDWTQSVGLMLLVVPRISPRGSDHANFEHGNSHDAVDLRRLKL